MKEVELDKPNLYHSFTTTWQYIIIISLGLFYDLAQFTFNLSSLWANSQDEEGDVDSIKGSSGGKLVSLQETFYHRRLFTRLAQAFNRVLNSSAGGRISLTSKVLPKEVTYDTLLKEFRHYSPEFNPSIGNEIRNPGTTLNLGSYNYLGFADDWLDTCGKPVKAAVDSAGLVSHGSVSESGYSEVMKELEDYVAMFLNKDDAIVFSMGYGSNTSALTCILTEGTLIISDSLNHKSIVNGCRGSRGTTIKSFPHNNLEALEDILLEGVMSGRYKKTVVVVEGIYSMEGETAKLNEIVEICKKYKAYIYLDEAHSIGALGETGRGICEHLGVDTKDVNLMMGTFSKSFGGMGGYVAGDQATIDYLRAHSFGSNQMSSLSPIVACQVLTAFKIINETELGKEKIKRLKDNSNYFRKGLQKIGLGVLGERDSPVIPIMMYQPNTMSEFSRYMLTKNIAVVCVGAPAVPFFSNRIRFCVSAAHTREDLKEALKSIAYAAKLYKLRHGKRYFG